jgi:hypothetical protein
LFAEPFAFTLPLIDRPPRRPLLNRPLEPNRPLVPFTSLPVPMCVALVTVPRTDLMRPDPPP